MNESKAETNADSSLSDANVVIRRGALSEAQRGQRQRSLQETVFLLQRDVLRCGCGQVLAFLECRTEEPYPSIRSRLQSALGTETEEVSLVSRYGALQSIAAVEFKERLLEALGQLVQEQQ